MSGEWFVQYFDDADPTAPLVANHSDLLTYNTSDNATQVWVEDHLWPFKAKFNVNYSALTFTALDQTENMEDPGTMLRVIEGKVIQNAGRSKSGNTVDSIYLKVEFLDDDPGVIYQIRGHMRTGFFEDEY